MENNKDFSLKKWYKIFIIMIVSNILILGIFSFISATLSNSYLNGINETYVPLLKTAMSIDMYHDGLRGNVISALYASLTNVPQAEKDDIIAENKEFAKKFSEATETINKLKFDPEVKNEFSEISILIKSYVEGSTKVINSAFSAGKKTDNPEFEKFMGLFKKLEEKLDKFSKSIQEKVDTEIKRDDEISQTLKYTTLIAILFFILLTLLFGYFFITKITKAINDIVTSLFSQSQDILQQASHLNDTSRELNLGTQNQNASLQKTASAVQEISSMIKKTSEGTNESSDLSKNSEKTVQNGAQIVLKLISCIDKIRAGNKEVMQQVKHGNDRIKDIIKVISEISNKTKVINDIVFKTKLLSFNASVEAARAGEHGRGFAVVAEEVGNLAKLSGDSAKEINQLLAESIEKVEDIIVSTTSEVDKLFKLSNQNIVESTEIANQCSDVMQSTVENVVLVNRSITEIATAAKEQEYGISEIVDAVNQLEKSTQSNAVVSEQTAKSGTELTNKANEISDIIQHLQLILGNPNKNKVA
ncbi:methyl-accepting chemotaxis protein [Pigmentibacter sp. JX0631]|uniref:HAMP domain-containing methyl-accepting chemotaxis protein n=1 Tax=Pigmentibacter sp. JX0631 TaxID=2976982 RepID=UPI0024686DE7|nr:methyl-accepting chemotaxis protein [Pigmentibacter sp. JX0631]WGL60535.1 methyl-accepting chemotaxis protein [Pigmentibacter sp. JX0631]